MAKKTARDDELATRTRIEERCLEILKDIEKGFIDQRDRCDDQLDYWDIYNCKAGDKQSYQGNAQIYLPLIHTAIQARKTRFVNQLFPKTGRYVDVVTENGEDQPHAEMALIEHYVEKSNLRTTIAEALSIAGDIEGQYNIYVGWHSRVRHTAYRKQQPITAAGVELPGLDDFEDVEEEIVIDAHPYCEVIPDPDIVILPVTSESIEDALHKGGSVTIIRRWTKKDIKDKAAAGEIRQEAADQLTLEMAKLAKNNRLKNTRAANADAVGAKEGGKFALIYETWTLLKVDKDMRLCRVYFGGPELVLSAKLCPFWCDRCPLISIPVKQVPGVIKGMSPLSPVAALQYYANDIVNEGADSATFSMLPIIMTDPQKNPRVGSMILDLAAVWETSPQDTQFAEFPQLWKEAFQVVASCKQQIFETLSVNPAMLPQQSGGKSKRNQAEVAMEQQVDILTTADAVTRLEEGIFTPIVQRFAEYDAQFRDADLTVRAYGLLGKQAEMEQIPPLQMGKRYTFRWLGVEAARNAAQIQQQIATANVLRGIPKDLYPGYQMDMVPIIEGIVMNAFGPRIGPRVFKSQRDLLSMDPETENQLLAAGFEMPVSPADNDQEHIQAHMPLLAGDTSGQVRVHVQKHTMQMQMKAQAQQGQGQTAPGTPGGGGQPGVPGVPPPGAQPGQPHAAKQPPGAVGQDQMPRAGAVPMPRKM